ncbi:nicotinate-nucleotide--dimethylbenzimidazole phosphoribosyltransferase [Streptomyces sp. CWNU-52B]|uniref:nicotinate-nucleotide--dimethylbenzimidazole phosphoribosyltransferase n=1 Tax=unclassified Streptomyces TaxID=2593676 RepID=UPI0039C09838
MTDTGQVPGEGLPESAGMVEQPGAPAPDAYAYLSESTAEDEDLLLLPGAQSAWGNEVAPPAPAPVVEAVHEPGPHETSGRDSGSVDLSAVRMSSSAPQPPVARRPLHLGPPTPDGAGSPVRSLADRGPAGAPATPFAVRQVAPLTSGPEYLDVPRDEVALQGAAPWGAQTQVQVQEVAPPVAQAAPEGMAEAMAAEPVFPEGAGAHASDPVAAGAESVPVPVAQVSDTVSQTGDGSLAGNQGPLVPQEPAEAAEQAEPAEPTEAPVAEQPAGAPQPQDASPAEQIPEVPSPQAVVEPVEAIHVPEAALVPEAVQVFDEAYAPPQQPEAMRPPEQPADLGRPVPEPAQVPEPVEPVVVQDYAQAPQLADGSLFPQAPEGGQGPEFVQSVPEFAPGQQAPEAQGFVQAAHLAADPQSVHPTEPPEQPPQPMAEAEPVVVADAALAAPQFQDAPEAAQPQDVLPQVEQVEQVELIGQAEQPVGRFVPVEGTVPTTPHLAPTPPHGVTPTPLPEVPAEETAAPAAVPVEQPAAEPEAFEAVPDVGIAPEEEPLLVLPAPREPEPVPEAAEPAAIPVPETPAEAVEPVEPVEPAEGAEAVDIEAPELAVVQQAADLDTLAAADQEEGTAAVDRPRESTGPAAPAYDDAEREAVLRVMRERRDIRNGFRSDPIPHDVLLRVLEAAHTAPSVGHSQPWDFVVIRSAETRRSMHELAERQREAYAKSLPKGRAKQFKELKIEAILDTPVNIVVTADPTRGGRHTLGRHTQPQMAPYSSALAVENLWLAARAEGLGVGWVSFFDEREMVRGLGLPEHLEVVAYLCVGYVDEFPAEPELMQSGWSKRRPLSWVVHEETYGRRALPGEAPHDLLAETITNIRPLDAKALGEAWERQKRMTKPAGALGMLEIISAQLSGLSRMCPPPIPEPAAVAIFAGDHGVHAQGVTPWPQEVTGQMVANILGGGAVCNAFAAQVGAEVCVIDVGVASDLPATPGLLPRKVRAGTADMTTGPALTREEVRAAIEVGIETARDLVAAGNKALITGEMGIANTTASAALISVFTGSDPAEVTGRGTGINDETLARKTEVVRRALELHQPDPTDPIGVLAAVGGLEHAAMVGLLLGGASLRTPVILDGVSAGAAALVARAIAPEVLAACIAGHRSAEPGHVAALNKLGLRPLVDLDLRLGEGTGALLALPVVQSAARAMHEVATFDSAGVTEK